MSAEDCGCPTRRTTRRAFHAVWLAVFWWPAPMALSGLCQAWSSITATSLPVQVGTTTLKSPTYSILAGRSSNAFMHCRPGMWSDANVDAIVDAIPMVRYEIPNIFGEYQKEQFVNFQKNIGLGTKFSLPYSPNCGGVPGGVANRDRLPTEFTKFIAHLYSRLCRWVVECALEYLGRNS